MYTTKLKDLPDDPISQHRIIESSDLHRFPVQQLTSDYFAALSPEFQAHIKGLAHGLESELKFFAVYYLWDAIKRLHEIADVTGRDYEWWVRETAEYTSRRPYVEKWIGWKR